jgi:hypothetical protein
MSLVPFLELPLILIHPYSTPCGSCQLLKLVVNVNGIFALAVETLGNGPLQIKKVHTNSSLVVSFLLSYLPIEARQIACQSQRFFGVLGNAVSVCLRHL